MDTQYTIDVPESELQSKRDELNRAGIKEVRQAILLPLNPNEYRITPRYSEHSPGTQLTNQQGEKIFCVAVHLK